MHRVLREVVRWKVSGWVLAVLIGGWWLSMMQLHRFAIAYVVIILSSVMAVGSWLASDALRKARPTKKQAIGLHGKAISRKFLFVKLGVIAGIVIAGLCTEYFTFSEQRLYELSQYNGLLVPANDPDQESSCKDQPDDTQQKPIRFYLGAQEVVAYGQRADIVTRHAIQSSEPDLVLLGVDRVGDGSIVLKANILGDNEKAILQIDKNHFEINRNMILDSLSPPRPDLSTIVFKDQYGGRLRVRFSNPRSVVFEGKMYFRRGRYVEFNSTGIHVASDDGKEDRRIFNVPCFYLLHPQGGSLIGVD